MERENKKCHYIRLAGIIALAGNAVLACVKFVLACFSHSLAITGDALDSSTDVLIAIVTLIISAVINKPSDKEHPWGHGRAETTATMILSFVIFTAGMELCIQSVKKTFSLQNSEISFYAILAAMISILGKTLLSISQYHYAKLADSEIVKANAQNMKNDIIMSSGILAGLLLSKLFKTPVLDPIIAFLVGIWVMKNAVTLFMQTNMELMDGNTDNQLYKKLFCAASSVPGVSNPHRARIRKIASHYDIDLDIEVSPEMTVYDAHEISEKVEEEILKAIPEIYDIVVHIEPHGSDNHQPKEKFGLSPSQIDFQGKMK